MFASPILMPSVSERGIGTSSDAIPSTIRSRPAYRSIFMSVLIILDTTKRSLKTTPNRRDNIQVHSLDIVATLHAHHLTHGKAWQQESSALPGPFLYWFVLQCTANHHLQSAGP